MSGLAEGVAEGWITAAEKTQLEELRAMTLDAISVDDFDPADLVAASRQLLHSVGRAA